MAVLRKEKKNNFTVIETDLILKLYLKFKIFHNFLGGALQAPSYNLYFC